jgi:hypothetical protein
MVGHPACAMLFLPGEAELAPTTNTADEAGE